MNCWWIWVAFLLLSAERYRAMLYGCRPTVHTRKAYGLPRGPGREAPPSDRPLRDFRSAKSGMAGHHYALGSQIDIILLHRYGSNQFCTHYSISYSSIYVAADIPRQDSLGGGQKRRISIWIKEILLLEDCFADVVGGLSTLVMDGFCHR
mgnify:CR=1 FL=1